MAGEAGKDITWIITLFLLGALGVLVIMNANNFKTVAGAVFGGFNSWGQTLTGSGYQTAAKGKSK